MASTLKRINLMLDEGLVEKLRHAARKHQVSLSKMARILLERQLASAEDRHQLQRIRNLRVELGPMPDSTPAIREARERGW